MNEKREPLLDGEPKYKKRSTAKGQPRSKHKHIYETVLLTKYYHTIDFKTGRPKTTQIVHPTKVCVICGRIDRIDDDPSLYIKIPVTNIPFCTFKSELSEKALSLTRWYAIDFWDKFATKELPESVIDPEQ